METSYLSQIGYPKIQERKKKSLVQSLISCVTSICETYISKKSVCSGRIGIASGHRKSVWSILSAQPALGWPQHNGCILVRWAQYNPHPVRPVHLDGPFHALIS